jgi:hypothetical protein
VVASEIRRLRTKERESRTIFTSGHSEPLRARIFRSHALVFLRSVSQAPSLEGRPKKTSGNKGAGIHSHNGRQPTCSQLKTDLDFGLALEPFAVDRRTTDFIGARHPAP